MSKILYIDADTVLYSSAAQQQTNKCLAKHKKTGREKLFSNKTEFNNWIKENPKWKVEDFEFEVVSELVGVAAFAFQSIRQKVDKIVEASGCEEYYVCIQGSGNFRNDYVSPHVEYKGHRVAKPILFKECFDYTVKKYGDNCIVSNGIETDDFVCIKGWESYNQALKTRNRDDAPYIIAAIDKDLQANTVGHMLNYNKLEQGIFWNDIHTQTKKFFTQVLIGDTADNIPGIVTLSDDIKKKYGIRVKGCGPASAEKILGDKVSEAEMASRVVEAYRSTWEYDWKQRLADNCFFLYLQRYHGDVFDVDKFFGQYGISL